MQKTSRRLTVSAMLAAAAAILFFLETAVPLFPVFLKFDFSDLPALIAAFACGPLSGVAVAIVKNLVHLPFTMTGGVGEFANAIVAVAFVLPAGLVYRRDKTKKGAVWGMAAGTLTMTAVSAVTNYAVLLPFYSLIMPIEAILEACSKTVPAVNSTLTAALYVFAPFTFLKGCVISALAFLLYKPLSPLLKGRK